MPVYYVVVSDSFCIFVDCHLSLFICVAFRFSKLNWHTLIVSVTDASPDLHTDLVDTSYLNPLQNNGPIIVEKKDNFTIWIIKSWLKHGLPCIILKHTNIILIKPNTINRNNTMTCVKVSLSFSSTGSQRRLCILTVSLSFSSQHHTWLKVFAWRADAHVKPPYLPPHME